MNEIRRIKRKHVYNLLMLANVTTVGIGWKKGKNSPEKELSIVVGVTKKLPEVLLKHEDIVPKEIEGFKTDVVEVGKIELQVLDDRVRKPGYSIGHVEITAGTLGCVVKKDGQDVLLSNAHVFTPDATALVRAENTNIVQPGVYDGGRMPDDYAAFLQEYVRVIPSIFPSECPVSNGTVKILNRISSIFGRQSVFRVLAVDGYVNRVDAAIAKPVVEFEKEVESFAEPVGIVEAELDMNVGKTGRTTGTTYGTVEQVDVVTNVAYGGNKMAIFGDQIIVKAIEYLPTPFSKGGDSGSVIFALDSSGKGYLDGEPKLCGLLFAGSEEVTVINRIQNVFDALGVEL